MQENTSSKIELYGMTEAEMRQAFSALGYPAFRGSQVFKHLYEESQGLQKGSVFTDMTDLPKKMREDLMADERIDVRLPEVLERQVAKD
ncbi:MAG: hypothetical protein K6B12_03965, partial [Clostridiales bacterium]|nr:hypothetical protein [Clostridiales bacterium]